MDRLLRMSWVIAVGFLPACTDEVVPDSASLGSENEFRVEDEEDHEEQEEQEDEAAASPNCGGALLGPFVQLAWLGASAEPEATIEDQDEVTVSVSNTAAQPLAIQLHLEVHDAGVSQQDVLGQFVLESGASSDFHLDSGSWANQAVLSSFSGQLTVWAVAELDGVVVETNFAAPRWFHRSASSDLLLYDRATRDSKYGKGNFDGSIDAAVLDDPMLRSIEFQDEAAQSAAEK